MGPRPLIHCLASRQPDDISQCQMPKGLELYQALARAPRVPRFSAWASLRECDVGLRNARSLQTRQYEVLSTLHCHALGDGCAAQARLPPRGRWRSAGVYISLARMERHCSQLRSVPQVEQRTLGKLLKLVRTWITQHLATTSASRPTSTTTKATACPATQPSVTCSPLALVRLNAAPWRPI